MSERPSRPSSTPQRFRVGCVGDLHKRDLQVHGGNCTSSTSCRARLLKFDTSSAGQRPTAAKRGGALAATTRLQLLTPVLAHLAIGQLATPRNAAFPQPLMSCPSHTCSMKKRKLLRSHLLPQLPKPRSKARIRTTSLPVMPGLGDVILFWPFNHMSHHEFD